MTKYSRSKCPKCGYLREFMYEKLCPHCDVEWIKRKVQNAL
jgi:NMD protein affecting ribosome stability and mRNA decay